MSPSRNHITFVSVTLAFFMWGLLTSLNDVLIPHLKELFTLNYAQAMLVQFVFFMAYALLSIPASRVLQRFGYKWAIAIGFAVAGFGCLGFLPSAEYAVYGYFLISLFVLATGIVILQVAANPYVSLLGDRKNSSARLTFAQGLNSLGTTLGPALGGVFILGAIAAANGNEDIVITAIQHPYLALAVVMFCLSLYFIFFPLPQLKEEEIPEDHINISKKPIWEYKHLILGCVAIFAYVGAEVSIGSFLINYLGTDHVLSLAPAKAASFVAFYWGGAMVGRLIGAVVLTRVKPSKAVTFNAVLAIMLVLISMFSFGNIALYSIVAVGLFNSILFPTIFSLAVRELGEKTSLGSGLLCVAIVGGAIIPVIQGVIADHIGITMSFIVPIVCYLYILFFGTYGYDSQVRLS
ncbi:sugar MFS transporter [Candidatus Francisella endociliophora]|nr:sugar MFS transporter [Francisella sp. FSC1006]